MRCDVVKACVSVTVGSVSTSKQTMLLLMPLYFGPMVDQAEGLDVCMVLDVSLNACCVLLVCY